MTIFDNGKIEKIDPFVIERYKYVLDQKKELNKITFKVAAIFQTLIVAIVAAQFIILRDFLADKLTVVAAKTSSVSLLLVTIFSCVLCSTLIVGGVMSWLKYREDESQIEQFIFGGSRPAPKIRDLYRWYETYIVLAIAGITILYWFALTHLILPILK